MKNEILYASLKPNEEIFTVLEKLQKYEPEGLAYSEIYERACRYFIDNADSIDFTVVNSKKYSGYSAALPSSFKVRINDPVLDAEVRELIVKRFNVTRTTTAFALKIVLKAYLMYLEGSAEATPAAVQPAPSEDVSSLKLKLISSIINTNNKETLIIIDEMLRGDNTND